MTPPRFPLSALALLTAVLALVLIPAAAAQPDDQSGDQTAAPTWFAAERGQLTLWHTQSQARADDLATRGQGAYELVADLIDAAIDPPLALIVWPEGADPSDESAWPDGVDADWLVLHVMRNTAGDVQSTAANALISAAAFPHPEQVPLWMRSALGLWSQGPLPGFFLSRAGSVVVLDHEEYYSLEQLETIPSTWQFQAKYFGQVGGMLAWMIQDWGPEALAELFQTVSRGVPFYDAVEQVYGIPPDRLIAEFTKNAERALGLTWPFIEKQDAPFYENLNLNYVVMIAAAIPVLILGFFIGKRMFYD